MKTMATALTRPSAVRIPIPCRMRIDHRRAGLRFLLRARGPAGCFSTGPQWGLAIDVLNRLPAAGRLALDSLTEQIGQDRKSTRLNSSHAHISYAVFCFKKKKKSYPHSPLP